MRYASPSTQKLKNKLVSDQEFIKTGNVLVLSMTMPGRQSSKRSVITKTISDQQKGRHVLWRALLGVRKRHARLGVRLPPPPDGCRGGLPALHIQRGGPRRRLGDRAACVQGKPVAAAGARLPGRLLKQANDGGQVLPSRPLSRRSGGQAPSRSAQPLQPAASRPWDSRSSTSTQYRTGVAPAAPGPPG